MAETSLPPVAKSFSTDCKKCGEERYHTVIAHTTATSAKMKCEICGATKTYKIGAAAAKPKRVPGAAKAAREATAKAAKATAHKTEYDKLVADSDQTSKKYNMKAKFDLNDKVDHPKFGVGIIRLSLQDKIEVVFEDEVRSLVHNRQ